MVRSVQPAPGATVPSGRGHGLERADGRRPHRHHAAALAPGATDRRRRRLGDLEPLRLHPVIGDPLGADRPEGPRADVERHPVELDAPGPERGEQLVGEVQARRRRGHGAGPAPRRRSGSAPSPRRRASGTGGCTAAAAAARAPRGRPRPDRRRRAGRAPAPAPPARSRSPGRPRRPGRAIVPTGQRRAGRRSAAQSSSRGPTGWRSRTSASRSVPAIRPNSRAGRTRVSFTTRQSPGPQEAPEVAAPERPGARRTAGRGRAAAPRHGAPPAPGRCGPAAARSRTGRGRRRPEPR